MGNLQGWNANDIDPKDGGFDNIPDGEYLAIIEKSEMKDTKSGNGTYLELTLQIIEGDFSGRKLWERLNMSNPKPQAVEIGQGILSAISRAVKVMECDDSSSLHDVPMIIKVKNKLNKKSGELENRIMAYRAETPFDDEGATGATSTGAKIEQGLNDAATSTKPRWQQR